MENEQYHEKIKELEKWLVLLLNNFYEGNPGSLKNIEQVSKLVIQDLEIGITEDRCAQIRKVQFEKSFTCRDKKDKRFRKSIL